MNKRIETLRRSIKQDKLDGILINKDINVSYLSSFKGRESYSLITPERKILITDFRYKEQAEKELAGFKIIAAKSNLFQAIAESIKSLKIKHLGFESQWLSFAEYRRLKKLSPSAEFIPTINAVERIRQIKDRQEIDKIKEACRITRLAFKHVKPLLRRGKTEREISSELEKIMKDKGAETAAFDPIVACGARSSMPHALVTNKNINPKNPLLIDAGARFRGYNSDLTRMYFSDRIRGLFSRIYKIVLEAQKTAIARIKPGVKIHQIDSAARRVVEKSGYAKSFLHALGHGVGLEIHEAPTVSEKNNDVLEAGMVFTVEPAIYIPGKFGVRIEDTVLVTEKGCQLLSDDFDK